MRRINLDQQNVTRPYPQAIESMSAFYKDLWGNPFVPHSKGAELLSPMEEAYRSIYSLVEASSEDAFVFSSSGAEAVNHVISSVFKDISAQTGKNHFVTSSIDEAPAIMAISQLESLGAVSSMAEATSRGEVTASCIADAITPRTALVSLSWASALTGVIHPVEEIAELCEQRGILLHLDATHILGKIPCSFSESGAHFITFNGAQLHAPQGTGGLFLKHGQTLSPFIAGGSEHLKEQHKGCHNVPGFIALGCAAQLTLENLDLICTEGARLIHKLEQGLLKNIPDAQIFFQDSERLPNCTCIAFPGVVSDTLLFALNQKGVLASFGGHCFQKISHLLLASQVDPLLAQCALSFSLSFNTTEEEIDDAIEIISECVHRYKKVSQKVFISQ